MSQNRAGALNAAGVFNRKTSSTGNNRENEFQVEFKLQRADIAFYSLQKDTAAATSGKSIRWPENAQQGHTVVSKALFGIFFFLVFHSCSPPTLPVSLTHCSLLFLKREMREIRAPHFHQTRVTRRSCVFHSVPPVVVALRHESSCRTKIVELYR